MWPRVCGAPRVDSKSSNVIVRVQTSRYFVLSFVLHLGSVKVTGSGRVVVKVRICLDHDYDKYGTQPHLMSAECDRQRPQRFTTYHIYHISHPVLVRCPDFCSSFGDLTWMGCHRCCVI